MSDPASSSGAGPSGPKESRSEQILAIIITMQGLSSLVLALRLFTRLVIQGMRPGADDWTILVSWVFSVAFTVNVSMQTRFGLGKHVYDLPEDTNFAESLELFFFGEATYYVTVSLTKVSILFLYLKLIPQKVYRRICWVIMVFVALTGLTSVLAGIFQCNPIHKAWDTTVPGTCFNQVALYLSNAGLNIAQDLIIYFLPAKMLWNLQLPKKQRLALIIVFVIGGFVCVTGMLRLSSLTMASVSADPTWDNFGAAIWSSIESNTGIICASLVHFKALIARFAPGLLGITKNSTNNMIKLGDEPTKGNRTGGSVGNYYANGRSVNKSRQFGILTEMELEDQHGDESRLNKEFGHSAGIPSTPEYLGDKGDASSTDTTPPRDASNGRAGGIHKTTHVSVEYGDRRDY